MATPKYFFQQYLFQRFYFSKKLRRRIKRRVGDGAPGEILRRSFLLK